MLYLEVPGLLFKRPGLFLSGWVVSSASRPQKNVPRVKSEVKTGNCMYSCVQLAVGSIFQFCVTASHDLATPFIR